MVGIHHSSVCLPHSRELVPVAGLSKCGGVNAFCQEKKRRIGHSVEREISIHSEV